MSSQDTMLNAQLGDYTIKRLIAKGGMGRVYEGLDNQLDRSVAIKVITLEEEAADELMMRFQREAKAIGQLDSHPNIVTIYRFGKDQGVTYIAMQYVRGESMGEFLRRLHQTEQMVEISEMLMILRQIASALDYAHGLGVIHRDVKPANVMLSEPDKKGDRQAILMDFGLVLRVDNTMTMGSAFGTPRYIAPEQALSSADACPQSDIYSLGIMVYEMLAGRPPFDDQDTPIGLALSHVTKQPPSPKDFRPQLPDAIVPVLMKVLEKDPTKRYQTASEFVQAVTDALSATDKAEAIVALPVEEASIPERDQTLIQEVEAQPPAAEVIPLKEVAVPAKATLESAKEAVVVAPVVEEVIPATPEKSGSNLRLPLIGLVIIGIVLVAAFALFSSSESGGGGAGDGEGRLELHYETDLLLVKNISRDALDVSDIRLQQGNKVFNFGNFFTNDARSWEFNLCKSVTLESNRTTSFKGISGINCPTITGLETRYTNNNSTYAWNSGNSFEVWQGDKRLIECSIPEGKCTVTGVNLAQP